MCEKNIAELHYTTTCQLQDKNLYRHNLSVIACVGHN